METGHTEPETVPVYEQIPRQGFGVGLERR